MDRTGSSGFLLLTLGLAACEPPVPATIEVSPVEATAVTTLETVQFTARVYDDRGDWIPGAEVEWEVRGKSVAAVSASGVATALGPGFADVVATHESLTGAGRLFVELEVRGLKGVSGDGQTATALRALPERLTVYVHDLGGAPVPEVEVEFETLEDGLALPRIATTNDHGEASTGWVLGMAAGTQILRASVDSFSFDFTATAREPPLGIPAAVLLRGRLTVPYREVLEVRGGVEPLFWSVASGSLPAGLALDTTGAVVGTPTEIDSTAFTVRVRDAEGSEAERAFGLRVCAAPIRIVPGEFVVDDPAARSWCPPVLPSGAEGDRYRFAVVRTDVVDDAIRISVVVKVNRMDHEASRSAVSAPAPVSRPTPRFPPAVTGAMRIADESSRLHARLLADGRRLVRELGTQGVLPDRRPGSGHRGPGVVMRRDPPPNRREFRPYSFFRESCEDPPPALRPAYLVAHNDHLAVYQDSAQQGLRPIRAAAAQQVLDYYGDHGASTIEEYFGGVPDINGDERVSVYVSPVVPELVAAFVWPGDFYSSEACSWSNEMELIYYNRIMFDYLEHAPDSGYQALPTMVHEVKHLGSHYMRLRAGTLQPTWIEEGTAEIAAEISSRKAMEAVGAVARGARLDKGAYPQAPDGFIITPENYGVVLRLARMTASYSGELNSLNVDPGHLHTFYGTSWHFHRFLGDAYGNASARGDGPFFTALNDGTTPPGIRGIESVTGMEFARHMGDYTVAMMLNGSGAAEPEPGFTTYDFPSATDFPPETFEYFHPELQPDGLYPWAHTGAEPVGFHDAIYSGTLAPGGIRFHEFESDGTGSGIELDVTTSDRKRAVRIVIVRVR